MLLKLILDIWSVIKNSLWSCYCFLFYDRSDVKKSKDLNKANMDQKPDTASSKSPEVKVEVKATVIE